MCTSAGTPYTVSGCQATEAPTSFAPFVGSRADEEEEDMKQEEGAKKTDVKEKESEGKVAEKTGESEAKEKAEEEKKGRTEEEEAEVAKKEEQMPEGVEEEDGAGCLIASERHSKRYVRSAASLASSFMVAMAD